MSSQKRPPGSGARGEVADAKALRNEAVIYG